MLQVDAEALHSAVYEQRNPPKWVGYLNRDTGEIAQLIVDEPDAAAWVGTEEASGMIWDRAIIEGQPNVWLRIPKMPCAPETDLEEYQADFHQFVAEFFRANDIEAELIEMGL